MSAVEAIATALSGAESIAQPLITNALAQKATDAATVRKARLQAILALVDPDRANALSAYFTSLCADAGSPCGGLGDTVRVPQDFLLALGDIACDSIKQNTLANELIQKLAG